MVTYESLTSHEDKIAVVGLGYVGLPLAVHLSRHFDVVGYDLKSDRIRELESGHDRTLEVSDEALNTAKIRYTSNPKDLTPCRLIIVAVPTPIDDHHTPDLTPLTSSSATVGEHLVQGACVVFESTVYPGATEEVCVPIMEQASGLTCGTSFTVGYSPERINPGDKVHTLENIVKIVSGSDQQTLDLLCQVYGKVIQAGIHKASSIKVAEAAKVIENTQRDLNIALMNELAMIFDKMNIDTMEVLAAAGSKWNFLPFRPGLVGGHCLARDQLVFAKENDTYDTFEIEALFNLCRERAQIPDATGSAPKPPKDEDVASGEMVKAPDHLEVLSYDPDAGTAGFKPVLMMTRRKSANRIQFATLTQQRIKVSDDHPMILSADGKFTVKLARDVTLSDQLVVNTRLPQLDVCRQLDLIEVLGKGVLSNVRVKPITKQFKDHKETLSIDAKEKLTSICLHNSMPLGLYLKLEEKGTMPITRDETLLVTGRGRSRNQIRAILPIDEDFARLIGYYLSRGGITKDTSHRTRWAFRTTDREHIQDVCLLIKKIGCSHSIYHSKKDGISHIKLSSNLFGKLVLEVLRCGKNRHDANAPNFMLYSSASIRRNLLRGVLSGGEITPAGEVAYRSLSKKLFHQVVLLLQDRGIRLFFDNPKLKLHIRGPKQIAKVRDMFFGEKRERIKLAAKQGPPISSLTLHPSSLYQTPSSGEHLIVSIDQIQRLESDQVYSLEVAETETLLSDYGMILHNCIGVDPYYLTFKAETMGYHPEMILAGRRINDSMGKFIAERAVKMLIGLGKQVRRARIAVLGITFKENVPDLRNTRVVDIIRELKDYGMEVLVHDPLADPEEANTYYGLALQSMEALEGVDGVIVTVMHDAYRELGLAKIVRLCSEGVSVLIDVKGAFNPEEARKLNIKYWRL